MDFTSSDVSLGAATLTKGFVAETVFTPATGQASQGTLIAVGGNFFVRYATSGTGLEYGYSTNASGSWVDFKKSVPLPAVNQEHTLSIAYVPAADGQVTIIAGLDGAEIAAVNGTGLSTRSASVSVSAGFGNDVNPGAASRGFKGSLSKSRFATLSDNFSPAAFTYQTLAATPDETCAPLLADPANYVSVTTADCADNILAKSTLVRPTLPQLEWQESRQTAFVHFGINTFYNQEWGHGTEDPALFNPTDFDADSWVKNLRDNGFRLAILTVKHHDGFLSYPSRYTNYSVKSSPWQNGKGDVLREFTNAAHKYGMKVGVYMSPADSNQEAYGVFGNGSAKSERTIPTLVAGDDRVGKDLPSSSTRPPTTAPSF
ncbi:alpha-L-fucosidase [Arthrobacter alpinus]|nr:alpha-L-fucosidase [Arthrobacter alpinus]